MRLHHIPRLRSRVSPRRLASLLVWIAATALPLSAQGIVSPADRATYEGSSSTTYPLGRFDARVQQLHADLGAAAMTLNGHAYRRDAVSLRGQVASYQIELSVTVSLSPNTPAQASRTFAQNVGATVDVLPRTLVSLPATNRPPQGPASVFELRIPWATPFAYPAGGGTLCLDTTVHGNSGPNGQNANFTPYVDAHQLFNDGRAIQPGYRYGQGCSRPSGGSAASASFELRHLPGGIDFDIKARGGMATDASGNGVSILLFGFQRAAQPWAVRPNCQMLTSLELFGQLPTPNTATGSWNGTLQGVGALTPGLAFHVQVASGHALNGVTLSDASDMVVPPLGPMPVTAARIAHGTDRTSSTGTVSLTVPVTEFF